MVELETLSGTQVSLEPAGLPDQLVQRIGTCARLRDELDIELDADEAPDRERLERYAERGWLLVWDILPDGQHEGIGWAFLAQHSGPPFVAVYLFAEGRDLELARDCIEAIGHFYFQNTDEPTLYYYESHPVPPEVNEALVDAGFDLFDDNPTIDNQEVACYMMQRYTYDAYFGEGAADEFEEY